MTSTNLFSTLLTGKTNINEDEYKKVFSSRTVRKLAAIQFVNGLFLIALHMLTHPYYDEDEERRFTGGFISGKKVFIVLMVLFYWVTGITGIIWAKPIKSRCSLCYLMTVIFVSSSFSLALITNSVLGFVHLKGCSTMNSSKLSSSLESVSKQLQNLVESVNEYNCSSVLNNQPETNFFRLSTERKILAGQIVMSSIYLMLKATLFVFLFRKFKRVYSEVDQTQTMMSQSTAISDHSSVQEVVYTCCLCCILNIWTMSCKCNEIDKRSEDQSISMTSSMPSLGKNYLTKTENSE